MRGPRPLVIALAVAGSSFGGTPASAQSFTRVEQVVRRGVRERIFPGAVLVIGRRDTVLYAGGFGHLTWDRSSGLPSPARTRYDVASLTKVVASASVAARLVDRGVLDLDRPVSAFLPCFAGGARDAVTLRMLLTHTSGLRAWLPLWRETNDAAAAFARTCAELPVTVPGSVTEYSDLNAILLGRALERAGGAPLDELVRREVTGPLELRATSYDGPSEPPFSVAPTTRGKGEVLLGRVNDENADRLGGIAGHAGLFATGLDLARFLQAWMGRPRGDVRWIDEPTRLAFTRIPTSGRPLGWDRPARTRGEPSQFGDRSSEQTFGHTGWTGTQLWVDPTRDVFVVFLTNRAHAPPHPDSQRRLRLVRGQVADAVVASIDRGYRPRSP
jgi:CubicO group peptidase (beta-lactamase class C family)